MEENSVVTCPHCGKETKLFALAPPIEPPPIIPQVYLPDIQTPLTSGPPPPPSKSMMVVTQRLYLQLTELTEAKIKRRTNLGDTALHRAAKNGIIQAVPSSLLTVELFMERNKSGDTPLHIAARHGYLHQIPFIFLTLETLTVWEDFGETPLHIAAHCGQFCRIPKQLLTPELLSLRTRNQTANTVLHFLAAANRLNLIPKDRITPELWRLRSGDGSTPRDSFDKARRLTKLKNESESWRNDPMTEKQKVKLGFFGCTWDAGITKGQASDTIDECVRGFPDIDQAYYGRPATEAQLEELREYCKTDPEAAEEFAEEAETMTCGEAKKSIEDWKMHRREQEQEEEEVYRNSEEGQIDDAHDEFLCDWQFDDPPTREQVVKAWAVVKSRKTNQGRPTHRELVGALKELFAEFKHSH